MSRYEWNPQCALICQNLTFKNRLTSSQSDRSLRLAYSQTTINYYQLHFSRLQSQTVIYLNTKRREKLLLNQPLSYFYEKQYCKNQSQSNITYIYILLINRFLLKGKFFILQKLQILIGNQIYRVYPKFNRIQLKSQFKKVYRSSSQNPQHTFLIEQQSRFTNKISNPTHNLSYEQQQSGQIPQSQQLIQPKSSKSEIKKQSKSQSQINFNKSQSFQKQVLQSDKPELKHQSYISGNQKVNNHTKIKNKASSISNTY